MYQMLPNNLANIFATATFQSLTAVPGDLEPTFSGDGKIVAAGAAFTCTFTNVSDGFCVVR